MSDDREERARRRHDWPGVLSTWHTPAQPGLATERLASMWQLALDAWSMRGEPLPEYARETMPGRLLHRR